jgi:4'-phosphopantetheinyl transferase EntD
VCTPAELDWLAGESDGRLRTMLFSAKEAVFKATFPIARVWLGFGDAELTYDAARRTFAARLLKGAGPAHPVGSVLQVQCTLSGLAVLSTTHA